MCVCERETTYLGGGSGGTSRHGHGGVEGNLSKKRSKSNEVNQFSCDSPRNSQGAQGGSMGRAYQVLDRMSENYAS